MMKILGTVPPMSPANKATRIVVDLPPMETHLPFDLRIKLGWWT
jgi:hypothetical protein